MNSENDLNLGKIINRRKFLSVSLGTLGSSAFLPVTSAISNPSKSSMAPLLPRRLRAGMLVGVVAPSSNAFQNEEIRYALDVVDSLGFKTKPAENLFSRKGYLAGGKTLRELKQSMICFRMTAWMPYLHYRGGSARPGFCHFLISILFAVTQRYSSDIAT